MKVVIIGAGVSGLSAGCYLQRSGIETEIYEQGASSGGLCTSWRRQGYTLESGFQWLLGSSPANPFFRLWSELLPMSEIPFFQHELRMEIEVKHNHGPHGEKIFKLYTDLERFEEYLLQIAPEDSRVIRGLARTIRRIRQYEIPPMIRTHVSTATLFKKIGFIRHLPLLWFLNRLKRETNYSFSNRLKNPFLREAFELLFDGERLPLMIITLPLAFNTLKSTGYPIGGGKVFVDRLEAAYLESGGILHLKSNVTRIDTADGIATGITLDNGATIAASAVLSTADWHFTIFKALHGRYTNKIISSLGKLEKLPLFYSVFMVSLGISRSLSGHPHFLRFPLDSQLNSPDGTSYDRMEYHIYNYDPTLAPAGSTVVSVSFITYNRMFWIELRKQDRNSYNMMKQQFANQIIGILKKKISGISDHIELTDIATPATYERYTGNREGAVQGWMTGKNLLARSPVQCTLPGLRNFYYASHWSQPGGGLPVAVKASRDATMQICHDFSIPFGFPG